jgi:hypothetical protein
MTGAVGNWFLEVPGWLQLAWQYGDVNAIIICDQSIDGLCHCNQGNPNINGVFLESVVTKKRQSSL